MNLKDVELLKGAPVDVLAEIAPKKRPYTVSQKVYEKNEKARSAIKPKPPKDPKLENLKELQTLINRIEELEKQQPKIKPIVIKEPVEINKPLPMVKEEEPLPPSQEEQYKAKENILKKELPNTQPLPSLPVQFPVSQNIPYKRPEKVNSILPFNWKNAVQRQQLSNNNLDLNKYLKGRKY